MLLRSDKNEDVSIFGLGWRREGEWWFTSLNFLEDSSEP